MEPIYRYSESTVKPVEVEKGKRTVFLRKDIREVTRVDYNGDEYSIWTYQEAKMTYDEFDTYLSFVAAKDAINSSEDIKQLLSGQASGDDNQMVIMEAIADLYDIITSKL